MAADDPTPRNRRRTSAEAGEPSIDAAHEASALPTAPPSVAEDGSTIAAESVEVTMGAVGQVHADRVSVSRGAIGAARADVLDVEVGVVGAVLAGSVSVSQGIASSIVAKDVRLDQVGARSIVAQNVVIERESGVLFLIAQRVEGNVRVLFDWRGAAAFGVAFGLAAGLVRRGREARRRR